MHSSTQPILSKRNVNMLMVLICVAYLFDYADRMVMASLLPMIKADWHSSDSQLGMLTSIVSLFIAIFVLPLSLLVDRWSRTKMAAMMIFFWSAATLLSAFTTTYTQLLLTRALTGIGEAAYAPASVAIIAMMYPIAKRAKYIGIWNAFAPMGAAIGFILGGIVGQYYGWRHALGLLAVPGLVLAIFLWFAKDYKTVPLQHDEEGNSLVLGLSSVVKTIKGLVKIKTLLYVFAAYALNMAVNSSMLTWFPSYLNRYFDMSEKTAGKLSGVLALLALVGAPLGGYLADKWFLRNKKARLLIPVISSVITAILLTAALLFNQFYLSMVLFLFFGFTATIYLAPATAAIQDVIHPSVRALTFGLNVVCMNLCGAFWAPVFVGFLSDYFGLYHAMFALPVFSVLAAWLFYKSSKHYLKEMIK